MKSFYAPIIVVALLSSLLAVSPTSTVSNGLFGLTVTLVSDNIGVWNAPRQLDFSIVILNKGLEDKALNLTYTVTNVADGSLITQGSGSILARAHQEYTYPFKVTTWESGAIKLTVEATGIVGPASVTSGAQVQSPISLGFLTLPLAIASLPLFLLGSGVAVYGLRSEEDTIVIIGAILAIAGAVCIIFFGNIWMRFLFGFLA